jgi:hypothetical protein
MLEIFLQFRYLFSFLSLLVKYQWFWEIIIIYLPVGHTHEKVDWDLFATIGNLKKKKKRLPNSGSIPQIRTQKFS